MVAGGDAPAARLHTRLARLQRSRPSPLRRPLARLSHGRPPEPAGTALAPPTGAGAEPAPQEAAAPEPAPAAGPRELTLDEVLEMVAPLEYHTHLADGVDVCPHFLLGCCWSGAHCPQHHTQLPYHWQLWHSSRQPPGWLSVGPEAHETLERLYSDPQRTHVRASYQGVAFDIDLVAMTVQNSPSFTRLRRLGTSTAPGTPFRTAPRYYWQSRGGWEPYGEPFVQAIEAVLQSGQQEVLCTAAGQSYQLDLRAGYQRNLATGTLRPLRARPAFRAPALLLPELWTLSRSLYRGPPPGPPPAPRYPETWAPLDPQRDWQQVPMGQEEPGFRLIYEHFHRSLPETQYRLERVWRVQNPFLWDKYKLKQSHMIRRLAPEQRLRTERHLFHGTAADAVAAICLHNLDPRLAGQHGALYGQGTYFALRASYSHRYAPPGPAGLRHLFLCKVLVGSSAVGRPALRRPPPLDAGDPGGDLYDSCVDSLADPRVFVVFNSDQCYPYFLLQYRELEEVVPLD